MTDILIEEMEAFGPTDPATGIKTDAKHLAARRIIRLALMEERTLSRAQAYDWVTTAGPDGGHATDEQIAKRLSEMSSYKIPVDAALRALQMMYDRHDGRPAETLRHEGGTRRLNIGFVAMTKEDLDALDTVKYTPGKPADPEPILPPDLSDLDPGAGGTGT